MNTRHSLCAGLVLSALVAGAAAMPPGAAPPPGMPTAPALDPDAPRPVFGGRLAVRAVQGTPGAPAIGVADVEIQLVHRGIVVDTLTDQLDEHGVLVVEDLELQMPVQPVVIVHHAGVTYQQTGPLIDPTHPEQTLEVTCYELTEDIPPWVVRMRHVMLTPAAEGVRVDEVLVLENPADHTWRGLPRADGKRITTTFSLPASSGGVELGSGFHDWCCTSLEDHRLVNHLPLMPGTTEMRFGYHVHATDGSAVIDVVAPAPVGQLMVLAPESMKTGELRGLTDGGTQDFRGQRVQLFLAQQVASGQVTGLTVGSLGSAAVAATSTVPAGPSAALDSIKVIAAVGGGVLLLLAALLIFARSPKAMKT